jgi:hypothetical protein
VRWEQLFADLEAQLDAAAVAELAAEVDDRTRHALGEITVGQRLRAATGERVKLGLPGPVPACEGTVTRTGADWVLLTTPAGQLPVLQTLVPAVAIEWISGLGRAADVSDPGPVAARLGLRSALRALARDRVAVTVTTRGGVITGTVDRVGADHLDVAVHPLDVPRRREAVRGVRTVLFTALASVSGSLEAG